MIERRAGMYLEETTIVEKPVSSWDGGVSLESGVRGRRTVAYPIGLKSR